MSATFELFIDDFIPVQSSRTVPKAVQTLLSPMSLLQASAGWDEAQKGRDAVHVDMNRAVWDAMSPKLEPPVLTDQSIHEEWMEQWNDADHIHDGAKYLQTLCVWEETQFEAAVGVPEQNVALVPQEPNPFDGNAFIKMFSAELGQDDVPRMERSDFLDNMFLD